MDNQELRQIEEEYGMLRLEYLGLSNKLNRYWTKLVKTGLSVSSSQCVEVRVVDSDIHLASDVTVRLHDEDLDASNLIELARPLFPSLHRRYQEGMKKHDLLEKQIKDYLEFLP